MNEQELDALAKRIVNEQEARTTAKDNENPNAYLLPALDAAEAKNSRRVQALGLTPEEWEE